MLSRLGTRAHLAASKHRMGRLLYMYLQLVLLFKRLASIRVESEFALAYNAVNADQLRLEN